VTRMRDWLSLQLARISEAAIRLRYWVQVQLAQPWIMVLFAVVLILTILGTSGFGVWAWHWKNVDSVAALTATFTVGIFALAAFAGVIAFAAYLVATQSPELDLELEFPFSEVNRPVLMRDPVEVRGADNHQFLADFRQLEARVIIPRER
jgi:hypothetical protein